MKTKNLIFPIILLFFANSVNANEIADKYIYTVFPTNVQEKNVNEKLYSEVSANGQEKVYFDNNVKLKIYLKRQLKKLEKNWKKEGIIQKSKYRLSYARVMFFVDSSGNILSFKIKSSCVPSGDTDFINVVKNHIKTINFDSPPKDYKNRVIVFTVKFNSFIPPDYTEKRVTSDQYGVGVLEISKNKSYFVMSSEKKL